MYGQVGENPNTQVEDLKEEQKNLSLLLHRIATDYSTFVKPNPSNSIILGEVFHRMINLASIATTWRGTKEEWNSYCVFEQITPSLSQAAKTSSSEDEMYRIFNMINDIASNLYYFKKPQSLLFPQIISWIKRYRSVFFDFESSIVSHLLSNSTLEVENYEEGQTLKALMEGLYMLPGNFKAKDKTLFVETNKSYEEINQSIIDYYSKTEFGCKGDDAFIGVFELDDKGLTHSITATLEYGKTNNILIFSRIKL